MLREPSLANSAANVMVEYYWLEGQYNRLPSLMADLVSRRVAVIATLVNAAALAAKAATTTTPIVFLVSEDPVRLGLVASLARPGGNVTGVNVLFAELVAKRLGLLHDLVPKAVRVAVLVNPTNTANAEATLREIPEAARGLGLQIQVINASTSREIDAAFATVVRERADALFVAPDITGPITEGRVLMVERGHFRPNSTWFCDVRLSSGSGHQDRRHLCSSIFAALPNRPWPSLYSGGSRMDRFSVMAVIFLRRRPP